MAKLRLNLPVGYQVKDVLNDNLDFHLITPDKRVFSGTFFTPQNILELMASTDSGYFWASDQLIVGDLRLETIFQVLEELVDRDEYEQAFTHLGSVSEIFGTPPVFGELIE